MSMQDGLVLLGGIAAIIWVIWYFFVVPGREAGGGNDRTNA